MRRMSESVQLQPRADTGDKQGIKLELCTELGCRRPGPALCSVENGKATDALSTGNWPHTRALVMRDQQQEGATDPRLQPCDCSKRMGWCDIVSEGHGQ